MAIEELEQLLGPKEEKNAADDDVSDEKAETAAVTKTRKGTTTKPKRASKPEVTKPKRASKPKKEAA
jgi:hypothetical protein